MATWEDNLAQGKSPSGEPLKDYSPNLFERIGSFFQKKWEDFTGITAANKNLEFQRENLDYQKALQQKIFEREDNSYQRTIADMRMAGLNPLTMQGVNGSGEAIATSPKETQRTSDLQALGDIMNVISQLNVNRNNNSVSQANANLINAQADNQKIKNLFESDILTKTLQGIEYKNVGQRFANENENIKWLQNVRNFAFNEQFGISDNMPDFVKMINYATHQGNLDKDFYKKFNRSWDYNSIDSFGNSGYQFTENPSFANLQGMLEKANLKGAINENALGNMFLRILGIQ